MAYFWITISCCVSSIILLIYHINSICSVSVIVGASLNGDLASQMSKTIDRTYYAGNIVLTLKFRIYS